MSAEDRAAIDELLRAGDLDGINRVFRARYEQLIAEHRARLDDETNARRASTSPYERAAQARRDGDPDWRSLMPLRWHISRTWDIYSVPLGMTALIIGAAVALMWWLK